MKRNLLIAGLLYAAAVVGILGYLVSKNVITNDVATGIKISVSISGVFLVSFLCYLFFFLKERKTADEAPYLDYLTQGVRITFGVITAVVIGLLFVGILYYFVFITQDLVESELISFAVIFFGITMLSFLVLKPRP